MRISPYTKPCTATASIPNLPLQDNSVVTHRLYCWLPQGDVSLGLRVRISKIGRGWFHSRDPACLRTRGPELDTGANSGLANDKHRYGLRELNGSSEAAHGPEGAGHATVRVPRREPGARATSRRPGSTPSKIGDREPEAGTLYPPRL